MPVNVINFGSTFMCVVSVVYCEYLQCMDEEGGAVDWYMLYKLPKLKTVDNLLIKNGLAYLYMTSNTDRGWLLSSKSINNTGSLPGRTLDLLYKSYPHENPDLLWLMYNDEPFNGTTSFDLGHTKGVVVANADGGFWLVHSVPKFPPIPCASETYRYPSTGLHYGQSFLCISMPAKSMNIMGQQLLYTEPDIYNFKIPSKLEELYSNLALVAQGKWIETAPWFHKAIITSRKGVTFQSFAKSRKFGKDLYADLVATDLQAGLLVESWQNGIGKLPSDCQSNYIVENVADMKFNSIEPLIEFKSSKDHSKWAVTINISSPWVCIGDINRMETQKKRGGGTVCTSSQPLWSAYRNQIKSIDSCPFNADAYNKSPFTNSQRIVCLLFFILIYYTVI